MVPPVQEILLVDDDDIGRSVLALVLRQTMYAEISEARSAEDALALLEQMPTPSLIVLDGLMPGMSGYELCKVLRGDDRWTALPIVLLSARSSPEAYRDGADAGATRVLRKPFDPLSIGETLMDIIESVAGGAEPRESKPSVSDHLDGDTLMQALATLRPTFVGKLGELADRLSAALARLVAGEDLAVEELKLIVHRLGGTAGSYGLHAISRCACELDARLEEGKTRRSTVDAVADLIALLRRAEVE